MSAKSVCGWCGAPATGKLKDERRTRLGSGTVVKSGPGTWCPVCDDCADRLAQRYGLKREVAAR